jgi:hypothetical protein
MSASASLSTRLRPGLFNFCRRSFGLKCSRTRENRMGPARFTGPDPPIPTSYWWDFWNSSATRAPPRAASASASFFAASRCACVLSCWLRPSRARSLRPVMLPTTSLALPLTSSIPLSGVRGLSDSRRPARYTAQCGTAAQDPEPSATLVRIPMPSHAQTSDAALRPFMQIVHPAHGIVRRWGRM